MRSEARQFAKRLLNKGLERITFGRRIGLTFLPGSGYTRFTIEYAAVVAHHPDVGAIKGKPVEVRRCPATV